MDPAHWNAVKDGLADALHLPPDERPAFLASLPLSLRSDVAALLAAEDGTGVLERPPAAGGVSDLLDQVDLDAGPLEGSRVGPYRLHERIGQGGMGDVYRARRDDGLFDREVALKVVRAGARTDAVLGRFAAERQILGRLRHPGIARLLDAGVEDERPWIAMDYVAGEPITEVAKALSIRDRVRLVIGVAEAVHTAHQSLVVHRGLKPSNVLVTRTPSGDLRPVLLDFGIAKILDPTTDLDLTSADGRRPMTLSSGPWEL